MPVTVCATADATGRWATFDFTEATAFRTGRNPLHRPAAWLIVAVVTRIATDIRNRFMASSPSGEPPGRVCLRNKHAVLFAPLVDELAKYLTVVFIILKTQVASLHVQFQRCNDFEDQRTKFIMLCFKFFNLLA
jgi:hypothetical protein